VDAIRLDDWDCETAMGTIRQGDKVMSEIKLVLLVGLLAVGLGVRYLDEDRQLEEILKEAKSRVENTQQALKALRR
jgi:hypothetical protein